jgi:signal transduction histidine kinase
MYRRGDNQEPREKHYGETRVLVSVQDSGLGLDVKDLGRMFDALDEGFRDALQLFLRTGSSAET